MTIKKRLIKNIHVSKMKSIFYLSNLIYKARYQPRLAMRVVHRERKEKKNTCLKKHTQ